MSVSGAKMIDILNALQTFIVDKLPAITECKPSPAEIAFAPTSLGLG